MQDPKTKFPRPGAKEAPQHYPGSEADMVTKPVYEHSTYKASGRLADRKALITGGDSGIGRAVALAFAKEGADVAIAYLPEEERDAAETKQAVEAEGKTCVGIPGDLLEEAYCKSLVDRAVSELGGIDILVNNAGLQKHFDSFESITADDFAEIYRVNVIAPFLISQEAAKLMPPGSAIVNTVSIQAYDPSSILMPYAASKGALVALTKALAAELIEKGIRVNAVAPGPIWSPLNTHGSPREKLKKFGEHTKLSRPGQPVELAPVYVLLASEEGSYITGEIYGITGGESIA